MDLVLNAMQLFNFRIRVIRSVKRLVLRWHNFTIFFFAYFPSWLNQTRTLQRTVWSQLLQKEDIVKQDGTTNHSIVNLGEVLRGSYDPDNRKKSDTVTAGNGLPRKR